VSVNLELIDGICSACKTAEVFESADEIFWKKRKELFEEIVSEIKNRPNRNKNYDCIIPVSGGKDSYYQAHVIATEYGLKPLLVTYHGNNYLPEGDFNRDRMRHVFDADHLVFGPSVEVLAKLNRIAFKKMGDMNWHAHCGIFTYPIRMSVALNIPLVIWGEIAWDISGMYHPDDFVEFSARTRHEHGLRGFEWDAMLDDPDDPLTEQDLLWAKYPEDKEILETGSRGIYVGNFFKWDPNKHTEKMIKEYGWKPAEKPFQRTYRLMSNLDDRYENGIHDLLKFVKFGYGRASDHASKDIRAGLMSREEGIEMVRKYDHVVSDDLEYWLEYVGMDKDEFWRIADSFRDPRVWWIEEGQWYKFNIWGDSSSFGKVYLERDIWEKYSKEDRISDK
jgi:N-acetyl sugar amidotransferase